jgi:hypothetical protein
MSSACSGRSDSGLGYGITDGVEAISPMGAQEDARLRINLIQPQGNLPQIGLAVVRTGCDDGSVACDRLPGSQQGVGFSAFDVHLYEGRIPQVHFVQGNALHLDATPVGGDGRGSLPCCVETDDTAVRRHNFRPYRAAVAIAALIQMMDEGLTGGRIRFERDDFLEASARLGGEVANCVTVVGATIDEGFTIDGV